MFGHGPIRCTIIPQGHPDFNLTYNVYVYMGALMGTLMFLNVWLIIWPAQTLVIASSEMLLAVEKQIQMLQHAGKSWLSI